MPLDLPAGSTVFIDANIFHYALVPTPPFSERVYPLMDRLAAGEITDVVSWQVLADTQHKVMMSLLAAQNGLSRPNLVAWAKHHPDKLQTLTGLEEAIGQLLSVPLRILPFEQGLLEATARQSVSYGLLTNDAMIASLMRQHGIVDLATNDDDFDRLPGIKVWKPRP